MLKYKELNDSDKDRNLAGAVIKVFKDSACTESITEFVLSYDGKSYGGDDRVVYKNLEERANANASKAIAKLQEDTYYYQLDEKLFRSNDDYSKTGYDYNNTVGSFSIVESICKAVDEVFAERTIDDFIAERMLIFISALVKEGYDVSVLQQLNVRDISFPVIVNVLGVTDVKRLAHLFMVFTQRFYGAALPMQQNYDLIRRWLDGSV